ncbi:MAG: hypothetical protein NT077_04370 [Candidatus Taylorbacteria bacterium]|nr:hypothetical protein [Candidatus Taylorbacteria bacterium]
MTTKFIIIGGPGKFELMEALFNRTAHAMGFEINLKLILDGGEKRPLPEAPFHDMQSKAVRKDYNAGRFHLGARVKAVEATDESGENWKLKLHVKRKRNSEELHDFYPQLFPKESEARLELTEVSYSTFNRRGNITVESPQAVS